MRTRAYIDTNIFVYAILHHPVYGGVCSKILRDLVEKRYEAFGSLMVAIELMGSLSKIDPFIARKAAMLYLSLDMNIVQLSEDVIGLASLINEVINIKYDAIHAAVILLNSIHVVITKDVSDWIRFAKSLKKVKEKAVDEGFYINIDRLKVVSPEEYHRWYRSLR